MYKVFGYVLLLLVVFVGCSNFTSPNSVSIQNGTGTAMVSASAPANSAFSQVARKATIEISANDLTPATRQLSVSANGLQGVVNKIPSGKARKFTIRVLDSGSVVRYRGEAVSDVIADSTVSIPITLYRTSGNAFINGTIVEDSITVALGYQFYKVSLNAFGALGGGIYGTCLTEIHLVDPAAVLTGYTVAAKDTISAGTMSALWDGNNTATPGHVKPISAPWTCVYDMGSSKTYTGLFIACWENFFYGLPTSVTVYGGTSATGPWAQIGTRSFSVAYDTATVALAY